MARYTDTGVPDTTFSPTWFEPGVLVIAGASSVSSLAPLADGSVLVAGGIGGDDNAVTARVTPGGTLDPTFNSGGATPGVVVDSPMGRQAAGVSTAVGVAAGRERVRHRTGGRERLVDARAAADLGGRSGPGFGNGNPAPGVVSLPVPVARGTSIAVDASSCPVAVGSATVQNQSRILAQVRFDPC